MKQDNITLIGMPGAGKSTLGVVLAKKLGYRFVDTDLLLQESEDMLLSGILENFGVEGFIQRENALLAGLQCEHHIIATGGSVVYGEDAMRHLGELGTIIFIDVPLEELRRRISPDLIDRGVVVRNGTSLDDIYAERYPLYQRYADITVDASGCHVLEAVELLAAALEN